VKCLDFKAINIEKELAAILKNVLMDLGGKTDFTELNK